MRILLTNDDGVHATGLKLLYDIACTLTDDVWVIAPEQEQSGKARAVTLTEALRPRQIESQRWAVNGTPTDCVVLATQMLMAEAPPDLILSGINRGQNLANDTSMSGTLAAAFMGSEANIPSIALSLTHGLRYEGSLNWETPKHWGRRVIQSAIDAEWDRGITLNINFPDCEANKVKGIKLTRQGRRDHLTLRTEQRRDLRGFDYVWIGHEGKLSNPPEGTDLRAIYDGYISVTPLHLDLTHEPHMASLRQHYEG